MFIIPDLKEFLSNYVYTKIADHVVNADVNDNCLILYKINGKKTIYEIQL